MVQVSNISSADLETARGNENEVEEEKGCRLAQEGERREDGDQAEQDEKA
jgi:hypothetical protein